MDEILGREQNQKKSKIGEIRTPHQNKVGARVVIGGIEKHLLRKGLKSNPK